MRYEVLVCAGGTGGHIFPAMAISEELSKNLHVCFATDCRGFNILSKSTSYSDMFCEYNHNFTLLKTDSCGRRKFIKMLYFIKSFFFFCKKLIIARPKVVVGFGGFYTIAPTIVSKLFGAKVVIHEQNIIGGKANKLLSIIADKVITSFPNTVGFCGHNIGLPLRKEFIDIKPFEQKRNGSVVIIGGSQGAVALSTTIALAISKTKDDRIKTIIHQVPKYMIDEVATIYKENNIKAVVVDFIKDIQNVMANAEFVISRAGASTLFELAITKTPAIFVPYKYAANNHQTENARYYVDQEASLLLKEDDINIDTVMSKITKMLDGRDKYAANIEKLANTNATLVMSNIIREIIK